MFDGKDWRLLCNKIDYRFRNFYLLKEAFTHPSYLANNTEAKSYQRLEFLGDRVINLLAADIIFLKCPDLNEGKMTEYHAMLTNNNMLANIAKKYGLSLYIYMSKGAEMEGIRKNNYVLGCVFEALVGAMFTDSGGDYSVVKKILREGFSSQLSAVVGHSNLFNPKSFLQDIAQKKFGATPRYNLINSMVVLNNTSFVVGVTIHGIKIAEGEGKNKREAEREASLKALERTKNLTADLPYGLLRYRIVNDDVAFENVNSAVRWPGAKLAQ